MWLSSFPNTIYWRDCLFSTEYSWLPCQILVDFICVGLFLALASVPLVYLSIFMPAPYCFDDYSFIVQPEIRKCDASCFVLFSQDFFNLNCLISFSSISLTYQSRLYSPILCPHNNLCFFFNLSTYHFAFQFYLK